VPFISGSPAAEGVALVKSPYEQCEINPCIIPFYWLVEKGIPRSWIIIIPNMAVCQNLVPLVNIKIAGKWMFIPLKMVLIGIDPYPYMKGSIIPELIINQQGFGSHCSYEVNQE